MEGWWWRGRCPVEERVMSERRNIPVGIAAGIVGGLLASWVMNEFMAGPGAKLSEAVESEADKARLQAGSDGEDATMKAADALTAVVTGGRHLTHEERAAEGPVVHYVFGALMGGVYGGLAEVSSAATSGFGTTFGSMLFAGGDLFAVPALKLSRERIEANDGMVDPHADFAVHRDALTAGLRELASP